LELHAGTPVHPLEDVAELIKQVSDLIRIHTAWLLMGDQASQCLLPQRGQIPAAGVHIERVQHQFQHRSRPAYLTHGLRACFGLRFHLTLRDLYGSPGELEGCQGGRPVALGELPQSPLLVQLDAPCLEFL
jgi:hypothetical protein